MRVLHEAIELVVGILLYRELEGVLAGTSHQVK